MPQAEEPAQSSSENSKLDEIMNKYRTKLQTVNQEPVATIKEETQPVVERQAPAGGFESEYERIK